MEGQTDKTHRSRWPASNAVVKVGAGAWLVALSD